MTSTAQRSGDNALFRMMTALTFEWSVALENPQRFRFEDLTMFLMIWQGFMWFMFCWVAWQCVPLCGLRDKITYVWLQQVDDPPYFLCAIEIFSNTLFSETKGVCSLCIWLLLRYMCSPCCWLRTASSSVADAVRVIVAKSLTWTTSLKLRMRIYLTLWCYSQDAFRDMRRCSDTSANRKSTAILP